LPILFFPLLYGIVLLIALVANGGPFDRF